jgi:hypothetical protein
LFGADSGIWLGIYLGIYLGIDDATLPPDATAFIGVQRGSGKNGRGREIRTPDILLPKQARYQTALYPDNLKQTDVC